MPPLADDGSTNFALYSRHAEAVDLCLFDAGENGEPDRETARIRLSRHSNDVFYTTVFGLSEGQLYGYRVHGHWDPKNGHYFNPTKLLLDPYARAIHGTTRWHKSMIAGRLAEPLQKQNSDSADHLSKIGSSRCHAV